MKTLKLFICVCISFLSFLELAYSRDQQRFDSLEKIVKSDAVRDTNYFKTLKEYAYEFHFTNPDTFKTIIKVAFALADSLHYQLGVVQSYYALGLIASEHGDKKEAIQIYYKGFDAADKIDNKLFMASFYGALARTYYELGNQDSSIIYYEKSIAQFELIKRFNEEATQYNGLSVVYEFKGNLEKSLECMQKAESLFILDTGIFNKGNKFTPMLVSLYCNISELQNNFGNSSSAIEYANKAISLAEKCDMVRELAYAHFTLGGIEMITTGNYKVAIEHYKTALDIFKQIGSKDRMAMAANQVGNAYTFLKKTDSAEYFFNIGLQYSKESQFVQENTNALQGLGMVKNMRKDYPAAIRYFERALEMATSVNDNLRRKEILFVMSEAYGNKHDYVNAYETFKKYTIVKDSIFDTDKSNSINQLTAKFESAKKDKAIAVLTKDQVIQNIEIKKQKLLKNSLFVGLGLMSIMVFLGYRTYRTRQQLRLQTLRNKIASDLHDDVGSTLSSISIFSEIAKAQSSEVNPMLEQIGDSSRKMLDAMADIVWTINTENDQFEKIILRMKSFAYELLGAKKIDFEFNVDENVQNLKLPMDVRKNLYLIFKEATNNLVKYAEASKASFSLSGQKDNLTMIIRDNGKGFEPSKITQGNGLKNMKKRAEEIGAKIFFESESGAGTTIQLLFNLS